MELAQGGSWRCTVDSSCDDDYDVDFDWTLRVPDDVDLELRNVNGGKIHVSALAVDVTVKHVNGAVELDDARGHGRCPHRERSSDGRVRQRVHAPLTFATVNGAVDLTFPKDLNADVAFSTVNGDFFTDFPYAVSFPKPEQRGLARVIKRGSTNIRIGEGGVPLRCETVNGNVTIHAR